MTHFVVNNSVKELKSVKNSRKNFIKLAQFWRMINEPKVWEVRGSVLVSTKKLEALKFGFVTQVSYLHLVLSLGSWYKKKAIM